jgi:DNA-binding protein YbaB
LEDLLVVAVNRALEAARQLVEEQLEPVRELLPPWMSAMADSP